MSSLIVSKIDITHQVEVAVTIHLIILNKSQDSGSLNFEFLIHSYSASDLKTLLLMGCGASVETGYVSMDSSDASNVCSSIFLDFP